MYICICIYVYICAIYAYYIYTYFGTHPHTHIPCCHLWPQQVALGLLGVIDSDKLFAVPRRMGFVNVHLSRKKHENVGANEGIAWEATDLSSFFGRWYVYICKYIYILIYYLYVYIYIHACIYMYIYSEIFTFGFSPTHDWSFQIEQVIPYIVYVFPAPCGFSRVLNVIQYRVVFKPLLHSRNVPMPSLGGKRNTWSSSSNGLKFSTQNEAFRRT